MKWKSFTSGVPYTCKDCPAYRELLAERDRWFIIAGGMAGCLDSSIEAGEWLQEFEERTRYE